MHLPINLPITTRIKATLLGIVLTLGMLPLLAQVNYPVQLNALVTPPYSVYLSDYYSAGSQRLQLQLLLRDVSRPAFPVKLRFKLDGAALSLRSREGIALPPFELSSGTPIQVSGEMLAPYLGVGALVADGADAAAFNRSGQRLPDGFYRVQVWAEEMNRSVRVSNIAHLFFSTQLFQPPILTTPANGMRLPDQGAQNVVFQWLPRHLGAGVGLAQSTYYRVRLVEVWPLGRDPEEAMRTSRPLYEGLTSSSTFIYDTGMPTLISGRRYALQVQASDADGREVFQQQGLSNIVSFIYGEECRIPEQLQVEVNTPTSASARWQGAARTTSYTVAYRQAFGRDTSWTERAVGAPAFNAQALHAQTRYLMRVKATCGLAHSLWSVERPFSTPEKVVAPFECAPSSIPAITDRVPSMHLQLGDTIRAADFKVEVVAIDPADGYYGGQGIVRIPFFRNAPMLVDLRRVVVNASNQLIGGVCILAENQTLADDNLVSEVERLADEVGKSLQERNPQAPISDTSLEGTFVGNPTIIRQPGNDLSPGGATVTVTTSTGDTHTAPSGQNSRMVDAEGHAVTVSQGGSVSTGQVDRNAFGVGRGDASSLKPAAGGDLPRVAFTASANQAFGFDAYRPQAAFPDSYEEQGGVRYAWKSVEAGLSDPVVPHFTAGAGSITAADVRYRTYDGMVVERSSSSEQELSIQGYYSNAQQPVLAVADTGRVDSLKRSVALGQLNTVGYDREYRRVWLVPVNGAAIDAQAVSNYLNEVYAPAIVSWEVQHNEGQMSLQLTEEEMAALCREVDVHALSSYTPGMQQALRKFGREPEEKTYLLFIVDGRADGTKGFMPLNRSAGFIYLGDQKTEEVPHTIAHELGHGAFGLEHVGVAANGSPTDNLMDYGQGTALDKPQWDAIHSSYRRLAWFDKAEDAAMIASIDYFGQGIIRPDGNTDNTHQDAFCILNDKDQTIAYLLPDGKSFFWVDNEILKGYFQEGGAISKDSYIFYVQDQYNRKSQPISWGIYLAASDLGGFALDFTIKPSETIAEFAKALKRIATFQFDINKTWQRIVNADATDVSYVAATIALAYLSGPKCKAFVAAEDAPKFREFIEEYAAKTRPQKLTWPELIELFNKAKAFETTVTNHLKKIYPVSEGYTVLKQIYVKIDGVVSIADNIIYNSKTGQFILNETKYGITNKLRRNQRIIEDAVKAGKKLEIRNIDGIRDFSNNMIKLQGDKVKIDKVLRSNSVDGTITSGTIKTIWP